MPQHQPILSRISALFAKLRARLGIFAWGTAVVFMISRGSDLANLLCKLFLGRVLPPLDFGAVEPLLATVGMLSLPSAIIFATAVKSISRLRSQEKHAQCRALIRDLEKTAIVGSLLSLLVIFFLRDFILIRLHLESRVFIWLIAMMFVAGWWSPLALAIMRAEHRYRLLGVNQIGAPFLNLGLTIVLVGVFSLGLKGAVAARMMAALILLSLVLGTIRFTNRGNRESYPEERILMLRLLFPMAVVLATSALATNFDRLFVRNFLVEESPGLAAIFTLGQIPRLIIMPITFVILPVAAAAHASGRQLGRLLTRATLVGSAITAGCCVAFAFLATPLLRLWRPIFAPYGHYVWLYALMAGLQGMALVVAQVEMARHRYRFLWIFALPTILACGGIYLIEDYTPVSITLPALLWTLTAASFVTLAGTLLQVWLTQRDRKSCQNY